jgi:hypothetical protein
MEKDRALFVAYYYWGYDQQVSLFQSFDTIYDLSEKFVNSYSQDNKWEDESFEEYMETFLNSNLLWKN